MFCRLTPSGAFRRFTTHSFIFALGLFFTACQSDSISPSMDFDARIEGQLVISPASLSLENGKAGGLRLLLRTESGQELSSFPGSGNATWTSDRPAIVSVAADGAISTHLPGTATISAIVGGQTAKALVTVSPKPDALRPLVDQAAEAPVGSALDSLGVRLIDEGGLPVAGITVNFAVELGGGSVSPAQVVTNANGVAKVLWRLGPNEGDNALRAEAAGIPHTYLRAVGRVGTDRHRLRILSGNEQQGEVGVALASDLSVQVVDANGNPVPNSSVTWKFGSGAGMSPTSSSGQAMGQLVAANANAAGVTRMRWQLGEDAGDQLAVASLDNDYEVWFSAKARPGKAFLIQLVPSAADVGVGKTVRIGTEIRDRYGNLTTANLKWSSADASVAAVSSNGTVSGVSAGTTTVKARSGGKEGSAAIQVLQTGPGALRLVSGANQTGLVGTRLPQPVVVQVNDAAGSPLPGANVSWSVSKGDGSISQNTSQTNSQGHASVDWTLGATAGTQEVLATSGSLAPVAVVASATAGTASTVQVTPNEANLSLGEIKQFFATPLDAAGNPLAGSSVSWASSNAAVAQVSATGAVTAVGAGSAQIRASSQGAVGTSSLTVTPGVSSLRIQADSSSFNRLNGQLLLQAEAFDANGGTMSSSGTAWNSRNPSVATVDQLGRVVSKAAGSALVVACLVGACDSISVDVKQLVTEVEVTPATSVVEEGASVQFSATARDPGGHTVQAVAFSWASTNPSVLAVDNSGRATGLQEGNATVRATASITGPGAIAGPQMTGQSGATVTTGSSGPPPPPPAAGAPELPRTYINTTYQAPSGNTIRVRQGDDLQAKINSAQRGDILLLDANATFVGNFRLPPKSGSGWVVLTTNTQLPPQGTRVTPSSASQFASIVSPNTDAALAVLPGASNYRIMGVEITTAPTQEQSFFILRMGVSGAAQNTLAEVPRDIIVDRTYIHGHPNLLGKRCIEMNASPAAVVDSYLSECHTRGQDSQAILTWNAPGPFKIVNNHLEGAGENVMFGGADPSIPDLIPSDIEIRGNYLYKPLSWKAQNWTVKNHFELKLGRRVLFENNILENNWVHAQDGFSVLIQSLNQGGNAPWSVVEHVTIRYNRLINVAQGMNVLARWKQSPSIEANNILIENNVLEQVGFQSTYGGTGRAFQALDNVMNLTIQNNTVFPGQAAVLFDGSKPTVNFVYQNNIAVLNNLGIAGSGKGSGNNAIDHYAPDGTVTNNLFVAGKARASNYPGGNHFLGDVSQVGFANVQAGDYRIVGTNSYSGIGADINGLNSRLANVLQGN